MDQQIASVLETRRRLPIVTDEASLDVDVEAELRAWEEAERERLGLKSERRQWVDRMRSPEMKREERDHVTLLISGLTAAQDFLVEGALRGLGYKVEYIGMSDNAGLSAGKEFGNRGQCNPTYYTVGSLVKHLIELRDARGMTAEEVVTQYVFLTAGACGPCRFGMYATEYRKALRDAGFDGFRVMLFQQQGGLSQATGEEAGIDMSPPFFIAIVKALVSGDVLNALGYRIRPYEVVPGATNRAMEEAKKVLYGALFQRKNVLFALYRCRKLFAAIEVDKLRPRAKTSIIGEFWAMTTEGDGNYQLQRFLESEGGECDIQLTTAWLLYNIWEVSRDTRVRTDLRGVDGGAYGLEALDELGVAKRMATLRLAELALRVGFQAFALPVGLHGYHLPDMDLVAEAAEEHYSNDLRGGEGHMEVGKLIVNAVENKAHITVSVKPFGCMPSSGVSDGVQSLITARHPGTIFCAVETSGDGATNFYSRIQMYMFKARIAAEQELARALEETGVGLDEVRAFLKAHARFASSLHHAPHDGVAGSAANLVREIAPWLRRSRGERAARAAREAVATLASLAKLGPAKSLAAARWATSPRTHAAVREDWLVVRDLVTGRAKARFGPLFAKLAGKAYLENNPEVVTTHPEGRSLAVAE